MHSRFQYIVRNVLAVSDFILVNAAFFIARLLQDPPIRPPYFLQYLVACNFIWLFSANIFGLYRMSSVERIEAIYKATWRAVAAQLCFFSFYVFFFRDAIYSQHFLFSFWLSMLLLFMTSRFAWTVAETFLVRHFKVRRSVAILGENSTSRRLAAYFKNNRNNFLFQGFLSEGDSIYVDQRGEILPAACEQIKVAASKGVKEIYVSLTAQRMAEAPHLIMEAEKQFIRLKFVPDLVGMLPAPFSVNYMGGFPIVNLRNEPLDDLENRFKKRCIDVAISLAVIMFVLSWLYPLLAVLIKLDSRGPVLFRQQRSGMENVPFSCLKFRSMRRGTESDTSAATRNDLRITRVGKLLRRTSLDELPQFINVLLGHMSVIGPRPHMLSQTREYSDKINQFMVRHFLKPGITGWAQVNGYRGEPKDEEHMQSRLEHDLWYMENWSVMLDVKIVVLTILNIIKGDDNAY